jgi:glutathione S-transferase
MVFEALNLPYTLRYLEFSEVKNEEYLLLTPNGRLPAMKDSNTGLILWEVSLSAI